MALEIYDKFITQTDSGETIPNATVAIYGNGGGLAPLFNDKNGSSTASNPFTADINGRVKVYLESGRYTVIASNGNEVITYNDVLIAFSESDLDLSSYGALESNQTWTGVNTFSRSTDGDVIKLVADPSEEDISILFGVGDGSSSSFRLTYHGTGSGNNNDISLNSNTKTLFRSSQDGIVNFPNGLQVDGYNVYNTNNLSLSTLGYTGASDANNYVHPTYATTNINTSGATIVDSIETNSTGHITDMTTRTLTAGDLGALTSSDLSDYARTDTNVTFDAGTNTTVTIKSDDAGESRLNLIGDAQGTGIVYVGETTYNGGGILYNGDGSPVFPDSGSDFLTLFRNRNGVNYWTARNFVNSNNWIFRGDIYANETEKVLTENVADSTYGALTSDQTWTGVNTFSRSTDGDVIKLVADPSEEDISILLGAGDGSSSSFRLTYHGTGSGNNNDISLNSNTKTLFRSSQDGIVNFPNGLLLNNNPVLTKTVADSTYAKTNSSPQFTGDIYANSTEKVYSTSNLTYGTGAAPTNMAIGDIYIELES